MIIDGAAHAESSNRRARYATGKTLRKIVPRESLANFTPAANRNAAAIIAETERDRIQSLIPLRRKSMAESPHAFLRGAADGWPPIFRRNQRPEFARRSAATAI